MEEEKKSRDNQIRTLNDEMARQDEQIAKLGKVSAATIFPLYFLRQIWNKLFIGPHLRCIYTSLNKLLHDIFMKGMKQILAQMKMGVAFF